MKRSRPATYLLMAVAMVATPLLASSCSSGESGSVQPEVKQAKPGPRGKTPLRSEVRPPGG